jgi:hypothetical protein
MPGRRITAQARGQADPAASTGDGVPDRREIGQPDAQQRNHPA